MALKRIRNIVKKEWRVMFSELNSALFVTLLPLIIVGQGILLIWIATEFGVEAMINNPIFQTAIEKLTTAFPELLGSTIAEQSQVLLLSQSGIYLLTIPAMIAISFATFSIVEEKQTRSLEALLATPVRTWELLLGKALSGAVPAIIMTWICAGIFIIGMVALGWSNLITFVVAPSWFITLFLLAPAVAMLSFMLGIIGSSRARDARSAQNFVIIIILPIFALIGIQVTGLLWFTPLLTLALALAFFAADFFSLKIATRLFQRESIVVNWR
jgi:ABC-2 type transport system permease protein